MLVILLMEVSLIQGFKKHSNVFHWPLLKQTLLYSDTFLCNRARTISLVSLVHVATCIGKLKIITEQNLKNCDDFFRVSSKANSQVRVSITYNFIS